ncbi:prohormone-4 isoform X1 [Lingula anatina]|uniref:Prohormone-4 isoform X1 n=1 Tax=Lingula anatina TaxID=7574 RepID=A0A1S3GZ88_LINAN|nr:prohormone-4 isoform X1 [Lingula anatina]XP_013379070.1 prohormone-4 isoform X1 [Lingula anatina]|eukprot:XP_013379068.1 prohormone-4 isoform X1 [Lingula anatina]
MKKEHQLILLPLFAACCYGMSVDLSRLTGRLGKIYADKRGGAGNPCDREDMPFPCQSSDECIPLKYVCDQSPDCKDGYDENPDLCKAKDRPAFNDLVLFLTKEKWLMSSIFAGKSLASVAHGLTVSQDVDDFASRTGLDQKHTGMLNAALKAAKTGRMKPLIDMGMPQSSSSENTVKYVFGKLLDTGFY